MTQITRKNINFAALRLAAATATDVFMAFLKPYNTYIQRSKTHSDEECDVCLGQALKLFNKLEKESGVKILDGELSSIEAMGQVCTVIDQEAQLLAMSRS